MHSQKPMTEMDKRKKSEDKVKDEEYRQFRKQNNMAATRSRNAHKAKIEKMTEKIDILKKKNQSKIKKLRMIRKESLMLSKSLEKYEPLV